MFSLLIFPSYLALQRCWLHSLTRITDLCQLIGIYSFCRLAVKPTNLGKYSF
ncbi:hypothetical protein yrohd0001_32890 [Yersinia rohdei ATCC 43380]|nr:hypothetical protein yrohd0001_32890 [Yersinia rohdei ATCC 43380]